MTPIAPGRATIDTASSVVEIGRAFERNFHRRRPRNETLENTVNREFDK
jgi:hypothetical protein